jgi:predicted transglutaminase-like cysteine proteinase
VRTDRGDLVLDNLAADIRIWSETPYLFLKRQSDRNTGRWVEIEDLRGAEDIYIVGR